MPAALGVPLALAVLVVFGHAAVKMAGRGVPLLWYERCALVWLLGTGTATVAWFLLSPMYRWISPLWLLTGLAVMLALVASRSRQKAAPGVRVHPRLEKITPGSAFAGGSIDAALVLILVLQFTALGVAAIRTPLGWDGLFNFELKARLAFEHVPAGQLPAAYFGDASRGWSHPRYPLLVPFTEFWIYSWLGRIDQAAVKIVFPLFYLSLAALVCGAVRRVANLRIALVAAIGLGCLPVLTLLPGAASGYADVPLAASVLGAGCFTFVALRTGDIRYVNIAAGLLVAAVWTKAEGVVLAGAIGLAALCAAGTVGRARLGALLWVPAVALVPWIAALEIYGAQPTGDFRPVTLSGFTRAIETLTISGPMLIRELTRPGHWGLIWPSFFLSVLFMIAARRSTRADGFLVAAVLVPLTVYSFMYGFSAWADPGAHIGYSITRLLVPLAPLATFFIIRRGVDDLGIEAADWA